MNFCRRTPPDLNTSLSFLLLSLSMQKLLLIVLLVTAQNGYAQRGVLYVKKNGHKTVQRFQEGTEIRFETKDGKKISGMLTLVKKDSLFVNGGWYGTSSLSEIILRPRASYKMNKLFLLTTAGVVISTAGMTLAGWTSFKEALGVSAGVGYGNYFIKHFPKLKRRTYPLGKKFVLQTLDLHF